MLRLGSRRARRGGARNSRDKAGCHRPRVPGGLKALRRVTIGRLGLLASYCADETRRQATVSGPAHEIPSPPLHLTDTDPGTGTIPYTGTVRRKPSFSADRPCRALVRCPRPCAVAHSGPVRGSRASQFSSATPGTMPPGWLNPRGRPRTEELRPVRGAGASRGLRPTAGR